MGTTNPACFEHVAPSLLFITLKRALASYDHSWKKHLNRQGRPLSYCYNYRGCEKFASLLKNKTAKAQESRILSQRSKLPFGNLRRSSNNVVTNQRQFSFPSKPPLFSRFCYLH